MFKGFEVVDLDTNTFWYYAVDKNDRVFESGVMDLRNKEDHFNFATRKEISWKQVYFDVPANAEFIGNYPSLTRVG